MSSNNVVFSSWTTEEGGFDDPTIMLSLKNRFIQDYDDHETDWLIDYEESNISTITEIGEALPSSGSITCTMKRSLTSAFGPEFELKLRDMLKF